MTYFGVRLRYLRKQDSITQQQLANALGIAKSTISMYENGLHEPDFETLEKIADYFNVPTGTFFSDEHIPAKPQLKGLGTGLGALLGDKMEPSISEAGKRIGRLYDKADERDKHVVETVLEAYDTAKAKDA